MTKELARYFFILIDKDLQFSFGGMGLPNNSCEWLENQLMQENFDKVEEFIKTRYDELNTNVTLEFFNQMQKNTGVGKMTDREQINSLAKQVSNYADEIVELKQENNELKKRVAELEKPKKKRKFRAMTIGEHCKQAECKKCEYHYGAFYCDYSNFNGIHREHSKSYKNKDGKYIFIEVRE